MTDAGLAAAPKVAVLLSTYNGEAFLRAQLDSLAAQEGVSVDLFVRDDGSTDGTLAVLAAYADCWPGLAAPMTGDNLGPAASFMALLAAAPEGFDAYAFCDQDDVWLPRKLARAARRLSEAAAGRPGLYCSSVLCVDADLRPLGRQSIGGDTSFEHLLFENIAFGVTVVINAAARRLILARPPVGGLVMHDWWCALTVSAFGAIVRDPLAGVLYRQHGGNVLGSSPNRLREYAVRLASLLKNPRRFYPIHAQAAEFQRLWGPDLPAARRQTLSDLVESRRTLTRRLRFAAFAPIVRARWVGRVVARVLIALDLY